MATVGYLTTQGKPICLSCYDSCSNGNVGLPNAVIEDPAPNGIYNPDHVNARYYDAACALCGWAIRREKAVR